MLKLHICCSNKYCSKDVKERNTSVLYIQPSEIEAIQLMDKEDNSANASMITTKSGSIYSVIELPNTIMSMIISQEKASLKEITVMEF